MNPNPAKRRKMDQFQRSSGDENGYGNSVRNTSNSASASGSRMRLPLAKTTMQMIPIVGSVIIPSSSAPIPVSSVVAQVRSYPGRTSTISGVTANAIAKAKISTSSSVKEKETYDSDDSVPEQSEPQRIAQHLQELRKWEYTTLGHLVGDAGPNSAIGDGTRFTLLCYNILAQVHLQTHQYLYRDCNPDALDWGYRLRLFFNEIDAFHPEIICLQEVEEGEYNVNFEPNLLGRGYSGIYKKRTRERPDGCAIFWKQNTFSLVSKLGVEYYQPHVPLLDRDNIGLMVKLQTKVGKSTKLVVATTHLLYNPKRNDVKLAQVQLLLAELDRFAFCGFANSGEANYYPLLLCGDFNSEPYSSIIRLLTEGELQYVDASGHRPKLLLKKGMNDFIPAYVGISDQCQHYKVLLERYNYWRDHRRSIRNGVFEFDLKKQAAMELVNIHNSFDQRSKAKSASGTSSGQITPNGNIASTGNYSHLRLSGSGLSRLAANFGLSDPNEPDLNDDDQPSSSIPRYLTTEVDPKIHSAILSELYKAGILCTYGEGALSHTFRFRNIYAQKLDRKETTENVATTKQTAWTCADYIFTGGRWSDTENRRVEGQLKLLRRLGLLSRSQCKEFGPIPNLAVSSDHYPLVAEFLLK